MGRKRLYVKISLEDIRVARANIDTMDNAAALDTIKQWIDSLLKDANSPKTTTSKEQDTNKVES